jgi:hypothetical protein
LVMDLDKAEEEEGNKEAKDESKETKPNKCAACCKSCLFSYVYFLKEWWHMSAIMKRKLIKCLTAQYILTIGYVLCAL